MNRLWPFCPLVPLARIAGAATAWCVATDGDDAGAGTEAQPWRTLQKAATSVQPGDVVRIRAGDYFVGPTWYVRRPGTADAPITYRAFGDGEVRISGSSVLPADAWTHVKGAIYSTRIDQRAMAVFRGDLPLHDPGDRAGIFSVDDMIPNSFFVSGPTLYVWLDDGSDPKNSAMRTAPGHVVSLYDCHHSAFEGLTVEFGFNGFKDQGKATHHIAIRKCVIRAIASQGIQPVARDCVIEGNLFRRIGSNKYQHGIYGSKPGTIVRNNVFEEIAGAGIHQYHQGDPPAGGNCEFSGNVFRKPRAMTVRAPRAGGDYYCDIIAWGVGGHRIFNNVFLGEGRRSGISLNSVSNLVAHNTFVGCATAIQFHRDKPDNRVLNNIMKDAAREFIEWPARSLPQTLGGNLYYNAAAAPRWECHGAVVATVEAYRQASGEASARYADPRLPGLGDLCPKPGSPALDAAAPMKEVPFDVRGVARPQGPACDLGAYERRAAES